MPSKGGRPLDCFQLNSRSKRATSLTLDPITRADLELPLGRHDLGVGAGDLDAREHASLVMGLDDVSAVDLASTNTTVVWALWTGETALWPTVWSVELIKKGVFLL